MISGVADAAPERLHRLVYWNAFVPDNESVSDMLPSQCVELFERSAAERGDGSVVPPFQIWREAFINDADLGAAECAYRALNPHPLKTLTDKISFNTNPAGWACRSPMSTAWTTPHRRITTPGIPGCRRNWDCSRLIQLPGGHELCFSDPVRLARAIMAAGRD
jgi:hypothetical protein